jgi:acetyl esterase/lipase
MTRLADERIARMGRAIGPAMMAGVQEMYGAEQLRVADAVPPSALDLAYGPDPRHRLDLYGDGKSGDRPILVFVHGGGFRRGAKSDPNHPFEANVGRFAAQNGMLGVVINYRLAPEHRFPAGGQDVARAAQWLRANAAAHGGDPDRIVLIGTSAGAAHIGTALMLAPDLPVAGAILLSGLYGVEPYVDTERDLLYFGTDQAAHPATVTTAALAECSVPLLVLCAEHDPPRFQAEFAGLLSAFAAVGTPLPLAMVVAGHNHFSLAMHLGTSDRRLADVILAFIEERCQRRTEMEAQQ